MIFNKLAFCSALLLAASTCFAQMYNLTDLGTLGGSTSVANGINASGQVVGWSYVSGYTEERAFRTAPNTPINPATDNLGTLEGTWNISSAAIGINASGQVVGSSCGFTGAGLYCHAFRTTPNTAINAADDLGTWPGDNWSEARAINESGQVVGFSCFASAGTCQSHHGFRTAANNPIHPATDALGTLGGNSTIANAINNSGQVVGTSTVLCPGCYLGYTYHAFRTSPNSSINAATDDLGTLAGNFSEAFGINAFGQVVGGSSTTDDTFHAFRTAPNRPINAATDDLGTIGIYGSRGDAVNNFGQVVGLSTDTVFIYDGGVMHDLNKLIANGSGWVLRSASGINDAGQITGFASSNCCGSHAYLLTPIYRASVQQPINSEGNSVFPVRRGVVPVKFKLTQDGIAACPTLPATIGLVKVVNGTFGSVDESTYSTNAEDGSNFRIDQTGCQYVYNLHTSLLGVGTYRIDISIHGIMVGHAVFALQR